MTSAVSVTSFSVTTATPPGEQILAPVSFTAEQGTITTLSGPSGCGKTTLMKALLGSLPTGTEYTGDITISGEHVLQLSHNTLRGFRRSHLAYVGQDPGSTLNPVLPVRRLISELASPAAAVSATEALEVVGLTKELSSRRPGQLSGGQQRRVALARALVRGVQLLVIDEPFAGLHHQARAEISRLLVRLSTQHDLTIVVSGHDTTTLEALTDRHVRLNHDSGRPVYAPLPASSTPADGAPAPVVLSARSVRACRGGKLILDGVDLSAPSGTVTAVLGRSGAGKTTLARVLVGLERDAAGRIDLDGHQLQCEGRRRPPSQRDRIQLIPQNPLSSLNPQRTVGQTLARARRRRGGSAIHSSQLASDVAGLLTAVDLPSQLERRYPHELSGGQRQRVAIARALAAAPQVLVCDEVTSALDATTAHSIMRLISDAAKAHDIAVVAISHDIDLIKHYAMTAVVLDSGRIIARGAIHNVIDRIALDEAPSEPH